MGKLTTHVLDTSTGRPAGGLQILLYRVNGNSHRKIAETTTNADGRTDMPLLDEKSFVPGQYELIFAAGAYLTATGRPADFLNEIPIRFTIADDRHYHVPLLLSPYGYTTYRGS